MFGRGGYGYDGLRAVWAAAEKDRLDCLCRTGFAYRRRHGSHDLGVLYPGRPGTVAMDLFMTWLAVFTLDEGLGSRDATIVVMVGLIIYLVCARLYGWDVGF